MSESELLARWRADLSTGLLGVQLVDVDHPLEIYVGASDLGAPRIQVRSRLRPHVPELSDIVVVDRVHKNDRWILTLTLVDAHFSEVFLRLSAHMVSRSRSGGDEARAWAAVDAVFDEWRRLLKPRPTGLLSLEALRGLIGETWFLRHRLMTKMPADTALLGWLGPMGAPQDFWYSGLGALEAKAIGPSARAVRVSSAEQLDLEAMALIVLQVPQAAPSETGAVNLRGLVGSLVDALGAISCPHDEVDVRLNRLGVDISEDYYRDMNFRVASIETYAVNAAFPAIRASSLPPGVGGVTYAIERTALTPHLTSSETLG
ncbi:hypothetical protein GCM10011492_05880 [Flexivirga endophytica]|uniref:PD-(D/E)XK motif protein n=1 Tax=Flexivirga endophytica TaxID=1849103 RepID=A0A916SXP6_9MICO|nr:PD-(D/E)XK motif protein [Flexivirga endophytica]GGB18842.1 hypothetical protein GCM10011492_05880 [Flexivirga endophytica]GHB36821.1 hypothetical protein GCM10008112_01720 [Flexivirga endophytica]